MQKLNEIILQKPILEETSRENLPEGVLCRVTYPVCNIGQKNANHRVYEKAVWERVLESSELQEKLKNRALFGQAEHPEQTQSDLQLTSHVIFEMWIDEEQGKVFQKMDVLDTPTGRVIDTLLRAGCNVGVSTRAEGDLEEAEDEEGPYSRVVPEKYRYTTTDFTADPSTFNVVPVEVKRNLVSEIKKGFDIQDLRTDEKKFMCLILESIQHDKEKSVEVSENEESIEVGDTIQILDKEDNATIVPEATVKQKDEVLGSDGNMYPTYEVTGSEDEDEQQWYSEEQYQVVLLKKATKESDGVEEAPEEGAEERKELEETKEIKQMYKKAGLPAPDGKGVHTKQFHELAIEIAKGYVEKGDSPKEALAKAYPTAMKQLGKGKAVKKAHRKTKESEEFVTQFDSLIDKIVDLKIKEASTRAERDEALDMISALRNNETHLLRQKSSKTLETKILASKLRKLINESSDITSVFRKKLEEKTALAKKLFEKNEKIKTGLIKELKEIKESFKAVEKKYQKELEKVKRETAKDICKEFIAQFVKLRVAESGMKVDANSQALLEKCSSFEEVDATIDEIRNIKRRNALHSKSIKEINVVAPQDAEQSDLKRCIGSLFEGFGLVRKGDKNE